MRWAALAGVALAAGCGAAAVAAALASAPATPAQAAVPPQVLRVEHDGRDDDLLTAGLGLDGLRAPAPPGFADPRRPTVAELRRRAIFLAWRGLIDLSPDGGAGSLFGPRPDERIAGVEILGALRLPGARDPDAVLLQLPRRFDPRDPCVVVVASSGSRGIYGALPTAGEWGLRRGCAVITSDKGTGNGFFDLDRGAGIRLDGRVTAGLSDPWLGFRPEAPAASAAATPRPHRLLSKHAHSGRDPQAQWGERLIEATRLGFEWLNAEYRGQLRRPLSPANTLVIASGISNGGAVVLHALELDRGAPRERWFDAAVVAEPNATVAAAWPQLQIVAPGPGARPGPDTGAAAGAAPRRIAVRSLLDYATLHAVLQPCAVLAETDPAAPLAAATAASRAFHEAWCADLAAHGDVAGATTAERAAAARGQLLDAGVEPGALRLGHLNLQSQLWLPVAVTYLNAHAHATPAEAPCGLGFAAQDATGQPRALTDEEWARVYSDGNGIPPTAGIGIVRDDGMPANSVATARCLRRWVDATRDVGGGPPATADDARAAAGAARATTGAAGPGAADFVARLRAGLDAIQLRADPGRRPVLVLHGRADGLVPVNHSARPWFAAARARDRRAELRYYEIEHGQHFDAFLPLPGMASAYVPMQPYLLAAMDLVEARLRRGTALPPSQVLRSRPRQPLAADRLAPLASGDLGEWRRAPGRADRIEVRGDGALVLPE